MMFSKHHNPNGLIYDHRETVTTVAHTPAAIHDTSFVKKCPKTGLFSQTRLGDGIHDHIPRALPIMHLSVACLIVTHLFGVIP